MRLYIFMDIIDLGVGEEESLFLLLDSARLGLFKSSEYRTALYTGGALFQA
jgi:hypothetical protein